MKAIVIAGTVSGVGKTTVTIGLMGALSRQKFKVQPFKTGPDYIDPSYHTWVTGETSRNLDTWLLSRDAVVELFTRATTGKDFTTDVRRPVKKQARRRWPSSSGHRYSW